MGSSRRIATKFWSFEIAVKTHKKLNAGWSDNLLPSSFFGNISGVADFAISWPKLLFDGCDSIPKLGGA